MHHKGFTLVELLVYIGVSTIVLLAISGLTFSTLAAYNQAHALNAHQRAFNDISVTLASLTQEVYDIDPASDLNTSLTQSGTEVILLSQSGTPSNIRLFMDKQVLYAQTARGTAALHTSKVRMRTCEASAHTQGKNGLRLLCTAETNPQFGLPLVSTTHATSFLLSAYAP